MATPSLGFDNFFSTTLSSAISSSDTTIPLAAAPTTTEGYLVIEPSSSTNREIIYYTSVSGSNVVLPSVGAGRGVGGTTAIAHSSGVTVKMNTVAEMFEALQDATALTGVHTNNQAYGFDFVASGCVWTGDSYGSTRNASMTSGVVYINGRRHTVAAVTARSFTASKDTYIDLLYSTTDNVATPVYTEVTNNAASPALASNSIRIGIIITGASSIANVGSVNQGEETKVLPIASSVPYSVTDSLGNLICPRDPNRKILGYRQITSSFTTAATSAAQVTGVSCPVIVPTGRKITVSAYSGGVSNNTAGAADCYMTIWDGTVGSGTQLNRSHTVSPAANYEYPHTPIASTTPSSASKTYNLAAHVNTGTGSFTASSTQPLFIKVELA